MLGTFVLTSLIAIAPPTFSLGAEVGGGFTIPPAPVAHFGLFGTTRFDSLLLRADATFDPDVGFLLRSYGVVAVGSADFCAAWAFEPTKDVTAFVGGGPAAGFITTSIEDGATPYHTSPTFGAAAIAGVSLPITSWASATLDTRILGEFDLLGRFFALPSLAVGAALTF